ncbi:ATP-binding protein [Porcipelethomonas sp.]|uniref:ATP-binding protein n=1 Tax=Porcipelethomonas sp. TaxID=2981675 RepID=UPI003079DC85
MKKKISITMCLMTAVSVIITAVMISLVIYRKNYNEMKSMIRAEAEYISQAIDTEDINYLESVKNVTPSRITWIDSNGNVIYDSAGENLSNHSDRPEIIDAVKNGSGESSRLSETFSEQTYYYAVKLTNGTILRMSDTTSSIYHDIFSAFPYTVIVIAIIIILAIIVSNNETEKIIKPINELDLDNPSNNLKYDELAPLLRRIEKQNSDIEKYISELKAKQVEFETVTENMSEGLIIINQKSTILSCNKSAVAILGGGEYNYISKSVFDLNHSKNFVDAVENAVVGKHDETALTINNRSYMVITNPVKHFDKISGAVIIIIDVTEKESREELRREFSANVSHELKTPLTAISGFAEIMKDGWAKPEDYQMFALKIYNETQRLINLIEDIIKLSRLDENKIEITKESVDMLVLAKDAAARLSSKAKDKNISVTVNGDHGNITGVRQILDEMIYNLCDNAIKYNKKNGKVEVIVKDFISNVSVTVKDNGIGIPAEDLDRVFERFYCVNKSHSKESGGTGLGLSIVKHGAIFHKAKINIDSTLGIGTSIEIVFKK